MRGRGCSASQPPRSALSLHGNVHKAFDIKEREGTRPVPLQVQVCTSACLSFFTCTQEKMTLSALAKGFEACQGL